MNTGIKKPEGGVSEYAAEIERLTRANRLQKSCEREQSLAELRVAGAQGVAPARPHLGVWPPKHVTTFSDVCGIPEIAPDALNADTLAGGIQERGSLIVRNLFSPESAADLRLSVAKALTAKKAHAEGASTVGTVPWYAPSDTLKSLIHPVVQAFLNETGSVLAMESPRGHFNILEHYERLGLKELLMQYFGESPRLSALKWVLRCVEPKLIEADWHQDGAFMGADVRSVNMWVALSHCGGHADAPGLNIIPDRVGHIVPTGKNGADFEWSISPKTIARDFADTPPVCPQFAPGDVIFFDHLCLHSTQYEARLTHDRYAVECWFFASSSYPEDQISVLF